jgi:hypothetical protein
VIDHHGRLEKRPRGVIGIVSPWSYPVTAASHGTPILPARRWPVGGWPRTGRRRMLVVMARQAVARTNFGGRVPRQCVGPLGLVGTRLPPVVNFKAMARVAN